VGVGSPQRLADVHRRDRIPPGSAGRLVVVNQLAIVIGLSLSVVVTYLFRSAATGAGCSRPGRPHLCWRRAAAGAGKPALAGGGRPADAKRSGADPVQQPRQAGGARGHQAETGRKKAGSASSGGQASARRSPSASPSWSSRRSTA
jgi:hypothetical protein